MPRTRPPTLDPRPLAPGTRPSTLDPRPLALDPQPPALDPRPARRRRRGAPRGNLNALKTGATSEQFRALIQALVNDPQARRVLEALTRARRRGGRKINSENASVSNTNPAIFSNFYENNSSHADG